MNPHHTTTRQQSDSFSSTTPAHSPAATFCGVDNLDSKVAEAGAILRHPRSMVRLAPGWRAPTLRVRAAGQELQVYISRRRVSAMLWERLTGGVAPGGEGMHFVTLSSNAPRWLTPHLELLVDQLLNGASWRVRDVDRSGTDVWHALMTDTELAGSGQGVRRVA